MTLRWAALILLSAAPSLADSTKEVLRVCHDFSGKHVCYRLDPACKKTMVRESAGSEPHGCTHAGHASCLAITEQFEIARKQLSKTDVFSGGASDSECPSNELEAPGAHFKACYDRHPEAASILLKLFRITEGLCD